VAGKKYATLSAQHETIASQQEKLRRLKAELRRVTEDRNIPKEAALFFAGEPKKSTDL